MHACAIFVVGAVPKGARRALGLKMAMQSYGDWDGDPKTFESVHKAMVPEKEGRDEFVAMVMDLDRIAGEVDRRNLTQPVTLEHAIRAKLAFDMYIPIAHFAAEFGISRRDFALYRRRPQLLGRFSPPST